MQLACKGAIFGLPVTVGHKILLPDGTSAVPSLSFASDPDTGFYKQASNQIGLAIGGADTYFLNDSFFTMYQNNMMIQFTTANDPRLGKDTTNYSLAQKNGANQQIFRIYNKADTHPTLTNYERLTLTGVAGASVNITAETAGTGGDNLDIILTPAGTGNVRFGVKTGTGDVAVDGYVTIKDAAGNTVKLATVA